MRFALTGFLVATAMLLTLALPLMKAPNAEQGPSRAPRWTSVDAHAKPVFRALRANQRASVKR